MHGKSLVWWSLDFQQSRHSSHSGNGKKWLQQRRITNSKLGICYHVTLPKEILNMWACSWRQPALLIKSWCQWPHEKAASLCYLLRRAWTVMRWWGYHAPWRPFSTKNNIKSIWNDFIMATETLPGIDHTTQFGSDMKPSLLKCG